MATINTIYLKRIQDCKYTYLPRVLPSRRSLKKIS